MLCATMQSEMNRIAFWQLPLWVRLAAALTLFNTWAIVAEFGIDRYGLDEYLPFYKVGGICVYEIIILVAIVLLFVRSSRVPRHG